MRRLAFVLALLLWPLSADAATYVLTWTDVWTGETAVRVQRKVEGGSYAQIGSDQAANTITYTDSTAADGTSYRYRVTAVVGGVVQPYSNEACIPTACSPAAPTAVHVTGQTTPAQIQLVAQVYTPPVSNGAYILAASCSSSDVTAAITASANGDTIVIPDGTCTWSTGVTVNKRVMIVAQHMSPVLGGRTTQSVIIVNNVPANTSAFDLTTGNDYTTGLMGIRFNGGTNTGRHFQVQGSGSKVAIVDDVYLGGDQRFDENGNFRVATFTWFALGGIISNSYFSREGDRSHTGGEWAMFRSPRAWATAPTMGISGDPSGILNTYLEDSYSDGVANLFDLDTYTRFVARNNTFNGSSATHHGLTSNPGARHSEWYNNLFMHDISACDISSKYLWIRGGTTIITDNEMRNSTRTGDYAGGVITGLTMADNMQGGSYPPTTPPGVYMPGWGHSGSTYRSEPIYYWNNTGTAGSSYGWNSDAYWQNMVQLNRDFYLRAPQGSEPQSGWTKYTYPHPLRSTRALGYYGTTFTATENPISQGRMWLNGLADGGSWANVRTNGATGTAYMASALGGGLNDATALLKGTWSPTQAAQATVYNAGVGATWAEVEIRLRSAFVPGSPNLSTGYEAYCSVGVGNPYCKVARWNGPLGSYCNLNSTTSVPVFATGDILKATISGTNPVTITVYRNGSPVLTATDNGGTGAVGDCPGGAHAPFTTGAPGLGFWENGATLANFGLRNFSAWNN